jgi:hypothetical protein
MTVNVTGLFLIVSDELKKCFRGTPISWSDVSDEIARTFVKPSEVGSHGIILLSTEISKKNTMETNNRLQ